MLSMPSLWYRAFGVWFWGFFNHVCTHQPHTEIILSVKKSVETNNKAGSTYRWHASLSWGKVIRFARIAVSDEEMSDLPGPAAIVPRLATPGGHPGSGPQPFFFTCPFSDRPCSSPHPCPGSGWEGAGAPQEVPFCIRSM